MTNPHEKKLLHHSSGAHIKDSASIPKRWQGVFHVCFYIIQDLVRNQSVESSQKYCCHSIIIVAINVTSMSIWACNSPPSSRNCVENLAVFFTSYNSKDFFHESLVPSGASVVRRSKGEPLLPKDSAFPVLAKSLSQKFALGAQFQLDCPSSHNIDPLRYLMKVHLLLLGSHFL